MGGVAKNASSQFTSEWEYYRDQNAKFADLAISAPTVGEQNNSQSFNIAKIFLVLRLSFQVLVKLI